MKETKKNERIFVKKFNKYLDELTAEEWEEASNSSCGIETGESDSNC